MGTREATAMAAYLASVGTDSLAVQQRRPPAMGAGRTVATAGASPQAPNQSKPESKPESKSGSKSDLEAALPILPPNSRATANGSAQPDQGNSAAPRGVSRQPSPDVELHAGSSSAAAANGAVPHANLRADAPRQGNRGIDKKWRQPRLCVTPSADGRSGALLWFERSTSAASARRRSPASPGASSGDCGAFANPWRRPESERRTSAQRRRSRRGSTHRPSGGPGPGRARQGGLCGDPDDREAVRDSARS